MSNHLQDKVVVVTGAGNGFGKLISEMTAAAGAKVVGADVDDAALTAVVKGIRERGHRAEALVTDVTDKDATDALAKFAVDTYGSLDVLVNNAGVMPLAFFSDHEKAWKAWHRAIDINLKGVLNGMVSAYDQMIAQGRGHIVNISSIYGNAGVVGSGVYSATKAAVNTLSDSLRAEAKGKIKVSTIRPTGVLGTNLAGTVINPEAGMGLVGYRSQQFQEKIGRLIAGELRPEDTDPDSIQHWMITPETLAAAVVHVIDQPWGIDISDITVRASGEDYVY